MIRTCPHCSQMGIEFNEIKSSNGTRFTCGKCAQDVYISKTMMLIMRFCVFIASVVCAILVGIFVREVIRAQCFSWTLALIVGFLLFPVFKKLSERLIPIKKAT